jgi:hypothetical protein
MCNFVVARQYSIFKDHTEGALRENRARRRQQNSISPPLFAAGVERKARSEFCASKPWWAWLELN